MGELKCNFTCVFTDYISTFWRYKESNELGTKTKQQTNKQTTTEMQRVPRATFPL